MGSNKRLTVRDLASGLGVAAATAHGYAKRGCPLDDLRAARAWVAANVDAARRPITGPKAPQPSAQSRIEQAKALELEARARKLQAVADAVEGKLFDSEKLLRAFVEWHAGTYTITSGAGSLAEARIRWAIGDEKAREIGLRAMLVEGEQRMRRDLDETLISVIGKHLPALEAKLRKLL